MRDVFLKNLIKNILLWLVFTGNCLLAQLSFAQDRCSDLFVQENIMQTAASLAAMQLGFNSDPLFRSNSIYRTQVLQKFNSELADFFKRNGQPGKQFYFTELRRLQIAGNGDSIKQKRNQKTKATMIDKQQREIGIYPALEFEVPLDPAKFGLHFEYKLVSSPDGKFIYSLTQDMISVIDTSAGKTIANLTNGKYVTDMAISSDGKFLYLVGDFNNIRVISTTTGNFDHEIPIAGYTAIGAISIKNNLMSIAANSPTAAGRQVRIYDLTTENMLYEVNPQMGRSWVTQVEFTADAKKLYTVGRKGTINIIDVASGQVINQVTPQMLNRLPEADLLSFAMNPDGNILSFLFKPNADHPEMQIVVYNLQTNQVLHNLEIPEQAKLSITQDSKYLIAGGWSDLIIFELRQGVSAFTNISPVVKAQTLSADGNYLITTGPESLRIYNLFSTRVDLF